METVELGDLTVGSGSYGIAASAVDYSDELPTYLRITDINDDGTLKTQGRKSIDDPKSDKYYLEPNDIVFARTGNSTGRNYLYDPLDGSLVYAGFLIKFALDPSKVNPQYVKYYCQSKQYFDWVASASMGSTRGNINAKTFASMPIALPERELQDAIVATVKSMDEKIRLNRRVNDYLAQVLKTNYEQFLATDLAKARVGTLSELVEIKYGKGYQDLSPGNIPVYGSGGLMSQVDSSLYEGESVLIPRIGTLNNVMYVNESFWTVNTMFYTIPKQAGAAKYVYEYLLTQNLDSMNSGSAVPSMTTQILNALQIKIPTVQNLEAFDKKFGPLFELRIKLQTEGAYLAILRDTLLPKLISGEIAI